VASNTSLFLSWSHFPSKHHFLLVNYFWTCYGLRNNMEYAIDKQKQTQWLTNVAHAVVLEQRNSLKAATATSQSAGSFAVTTTVDNVFTVHSLRPMLLMVNPECLFKPVEIDQLKCTTQHALSLLSPHLVSKGISIQRCLRNSRPVVWQQQIIQPDYVAQNT